MAYKKSNIGGILTIILVIILALGSLGVALNFDRIFSSTEEPTTLPAAAQNGKSAYELAVLNGFEGSVDEWLESLKGATGATGPVGPQGPQGELPETPNIDDLLVFNSTFAPEYDEVTQGFKNFNSDFYLPNEGEFNIAVVDYKIEFNHKYRLGIYMETTESIGAYYEMGLGHIDHDDMGGMMPPDYCTPGGGLQFYELFYNGEVEFLINPNNTYQTTFYENSLKSWSSMGWYGQYIMPSSFIGNVENNTATMDNYFCFSNIQMTGALSTTMPNVTIKIWDLGVVA